jgi:hypothetical protein
MNKTIAAFLLLGAASVLTGQPEPVSTATPVALEFKAVSMGRGIGDLGVMQNGKKTPFYAPALTLSPAVSYLGKPELIFTQTQWMAGAPSEAIVATATVPAGLNKALILFSQTATHPNRYTAVLVPNNDTNTALNQVRIINYTNRAINLILNNSPHSISPGVTTTTPLRNGALQLAIPRVNPASQDTAEVFHETYTPSPDSRLTLILTSPNKAQTAEDQAVSVLSLVDTAAPATATEKTK